MARTRGGRGVSPVFRARVSAMEDSSTFSLAITGSGSGLHSTVVSPAARGSISRATVGTATPSLLSPSRHIVGGPGGSALPRLIYSSGHSSPSTSVGGGLGRATTTGISEGSGREDPPSSARGLEGQRDTGGSTGRSPRIGGGPRTVPSRTPITSSLTRLLAAVTRVFRLRSAIATRRTAGSPSARSAGGVVLA